MPAALSAQACVISDTKKDVQNRLVLTIWAGVICLLIKLLIYKVNSGLCFWLEYHLEYHLECRAKLATRLHSI